VSKGLAEAEASHRQGLGSNSGQSIWDLWRAEWHWDRSLSLQATLVFPVRISPPMPDTHIPFTQHRCYISPVANSVIKEEGPSIQSCYIKPIWTDGIELWGSASNSSIAILQRRQTKILRSMADTPRCVSNSTLHNDLGIPFIKDVLQERSTRHHERLEVHPNALLQPLLEESNNRRLKRRLPIDLK
jgi:hypothetical protein